MRDPTKDKGRLRGFLERINRTHGSKKPETGTPEFGTYTEARGLERILSDLIAGRRVLLPAPTMLAAQRTGSRVVLEEAKRDNPALDDMLRLVQLVDSAGVGRVRQCKLPGCGRWFVARKAQTYCTLAHSNRGSYLAYRERQQKKIRRPTP